MGGFLPGQLRFTEDGNHCSGCPELIQAEAHQAVNARDQAMSALCAAELAFALLPCVADLILPSLGSGQTRRPCQGKLYVTSFRGCVFSTSGVLGLHAGPSHQTLEPFGEHLCFVRRGDLPVQIFHGSIGWLIPLNLVGLHARVPLIAGLW